MTKDTTPPPPETATSTASTAAHEPPSLPASPLPKRTKTTTSNNEIALSSIASVMASTNGNGTAVTSISQPQSSLLVKKLVESAKAPTRGSVFAAGYDLYSAKETVIPAKGKGLVDTGLAIAVPEGTCMLSSLLYSSCLPNLVECCH
jgi:dUTP pyrophosphatase